MPDITKRPAAKAKSAAETQRKRTRASGQREQRECQDRIGTPENGKQRTLKQLQAYERSAIDGMQEMLLKWLKIFHLEAERIQGTIATYSMALRQGRKCKVPSPEAAVPGWGLVADGPTEGLKAIRLVSAPPGCKNLQGMKDAIVKARLTTLSA